MVDGHLNFDVKIDTSGFNKGTQAITKSFGGMKKVLIGISATLAGLFSAKEMIEYAAEVKALNAQFEQTFGLMQEAAGKAIDAIADSSGIINTRLKGTATQIYAFAKTAGMDGTQALDLMSEALQVTADSAAYYDRSLEDTAATLQSFLKGNYANDAALGLSATETTRNAAAMELYGKKFQDLSEAQKQFTLLQMVKDANRLSGAMGQAARESEGWENVLGNLKEAWKQMLAAVGQPLLALAIPIVKRLTAVLQTLTKIATQAANALTKVFGLDLGTGADNSAQIADDAEQAAESYEDMAAAAEEAKEANEGSLASFDQINKLDDDTTDTSTAGSTDVGGITSGGAVLTLDINTEEADGKFEKWLVKIKNGFESAKQTISNGIAAVRQYASNNFGDIWDDLTDGLLQESIELGQTFQKIGSDLSTLTEPLKAYFTKDFTPYLQTVFSTLSDIVVGLYDTFNMVFSDIWDIAVFPILQNFVTAGLPLITQFATQVWETIDTLFNNLKLLFDQYWQDFIAPYIELAVSVWTDFVTLVKEKWDEYGKPIFEELRTAIDETTAIISEFWRKWIKPIFDYAMEKAQEIWDDYLKPLLDNIISLVAELILTVEPIYNDIIAPLISWLVDKLAPVVTWVGKGIVDDVSNRIKAILVLVNYIVSFLRSNLQTVKDDIYSRVAAIKGIFKGLTTFLKGVFTGDFSKAWAGIRQIFKGAWDLMVATVKSPINKIIGFINTMISGVTDGLNSLLGALSEVVNAISDAVGSLTFDIPDWVPEYGGMSIGFDLPKWYPGTLEPPEIPKLATGAYIPANYGEFAAILGDNKREAEIVSPISAMKQALLEAMVEYHGAGGNEQQVPIVITLDGKVLGNSMIKFVNGKTKQNGKSPLISVKGV